MYAVRTQLEAAFLSIETSKSLSEELTTSDKLTTGHVTKDSETNQTR